MHLSKDADFKNSLGKVDTVRYYLCKTVLKKDKKRKLGKINIRMDM